MKNVLVRGANALLSPLRFEADRALFWSPYYPSNFGELIGPFLYEQITGEAPWFRLPEDLSRSSVYMTAGSIMGFAKGNAIVWGSGILRRDQTFGRPWRTLAVRGPHTLAAFHRVGYPCPETFGDPAIVLPLVYLPPPLPKRFAVGLIPHFRDLPVLRERLVAHEDVLLIDVRHPIEDIIAQVRQCYGVLSSSLHGLIVSHAYGVPAQWVLWGHESGDGVKYQDYYASLGEREMKPLDCRQPSTLGSDLLLSWVIDAPLLHSRHLAEALLKVCPFPKAAIGRGGP